MSQPENESNPSRAVPPPIPSKQPASSMSDDPGMRVLLPVGRSGWAIAAGYLGLFALIPVFAPFALIVSIIALLDLKKAKQQGQTKYGKGRAIFGLIIGIVGTLLLASFVVIGLLSSGQQG